MKAAEALETKEYVLENSGTLKQGSASFRRRLPIGAEVMPQGGAHFRVWAPNHNKVSVIFEQAESSASSLTDEVVLERESGDYFSAYVPEAKAGQCYRFRLDDEKDLLPDSASRFQPEGPHGPSQIIDPGEFKWTDPKWTGVPAERQVIYEIHLGTYTSEGTWRAAAKHLEELASLGITTLEIMPVADFSGRFGWGYDGVNMFAPSRLYGSPDDFRAFVDQAHRHGLAVILDVVYNHLGPDGNYVMKFAKDFFTDHYKCEWGEAINFDGPRSEGVRQFFITNARYWIEEFHLDGLRLDATQQIFDSSPQHILTEIGQTVRNAAAGRSTFIVAENEVQHTRLVRPIDEGGYGLDALWNDDFHHSAFVAMTGQNPAYYTDYLGKPQEFVSAAKYGYLYQGQYYKWQKKRRGSPAFGLNPSHFVTFIENHDQVANSLHGRRIHQLTNPGLCRAMTGLLLLGPGVPMLFQGQEFASSSPFLYFADHTPELAKLVSKGRKEFLSQFPNLALPEALRMIAEPADESTFRRCKLDFNEKTKHQHVYQMYRDLLRLRRDDPVLKQIGAAGIDGAVIGDDAFLIRFFGEHSGDRLLVVNLGRDLWLEPMPEPLAAPPEDSHWKIAWSSEETRYGGNGTPPLAAEKNWHLPGHAALFLVPVPSKEEKNG